MKTIILLLFILLLVRVHTQAQGMSGTKSLYISSPNEPSCNRSVVRKNPDLILSPVISTVSGVKKTVSLQQLKRLRVAAIVLSSIAGTLQLTGTGFVLSGVSYRNPNNAFGNELIGVIALYSGTVPAAAGLGTWIAYGCRLHRYKRQQAMGQF